MKAYYKMINFNKIVKFSQKHARILKSKLANSNNPLYCMFAATNNCNSRCIMCNFWKNKSTNELTVNEIRTMFSSKTFQNLVSVAITGGEPLVRPDIDEIIQVIYDTTGIKPSISTNGFTPKRLKNILESKHKIIDSVGVSLDGLQDTHDRIRGIKDGFQKVNESIEVIKSFGLKASVNMTLFGENYKNLYETWLRYRNDNFSYKVAQISTVYYGDNTDVNLNINETVKNTILAQMEKIDDKNLYNLFLKDWIKFGKRPSPCYAGQYEVYIDAWGNIFPCIHKPRFGNIREEPLEEIWNSEAAESLRKVYRTCQDCYERCTVSTFDVDWLRWLPARLLGRRATNNGKIPHMAR